MIQLHKHLPGMVCNTVNWTLLNTCISLFSFHWVVTCLGYRYPRGKVNVKLRSTICIHCIFVLHTIACYYYNCGFVCMFTKYKNNVHIGKVHALYTSCTHCSPDFLLSVPFRVAMEAFIWENKANNNTITTLVIQFWIT